MTTSNDNLNDTSASTSPEAQSEATTAVLVTEREWKSTHKTQLFGLAKEPFRGRKKIPGYAPILLRDDAFAIVKQMASQSTTRMVGAKEVLSAIVLLAIEGNQALNQTVLSKAKAIVRDDVARELDRAEEL